MKKVVNFQNACTGRLLDFKNLPEPQNSEEVSKQLYNSQGEMLGIDYLDEQVNKRQVRECQGEPMAMDNSNWVNIHSSFTPQLAQSWQNLNFTYQQTQDWVNAGLQPTDYNFAVWFRDIKRVDAEWVLNHASEVQLRQEHQKLSTASSSWTTS